MTQVIEVAVGVTIALLILGCFCCMKSCGEAEEKAGYK